MPAEIAVTANNKVHVPVLFEDADLIIVDKPAGLVVQPGKGHARDSLLNGLYALREGAMGRILHNLGERRDFGLLHRLDKDTSGLLVVAKSPNAYDPLRRDFEARKIEKEYLTMVLGQPKPAQGVIQARLKEITEPGTHMKKVMISRQGQEAISAYQVVKTKEWVGKKGSGAVELSMVRVKIKTGRLHQIRAHMLFLGTPVLGDEMYVLPGTAAGMAAGAGSGGKRVGIPVPPRLCLHAARLGFKHPISGKFVKFEVGLPEDLAGYARALGLG